MIAQNSAQFAGMMVYAPTITAQDTTAIERIAEQARAEYMQASAAAGQYRIDFMARAMNFCRQVVDFAVVSRNRSRSRSRLAEMSTRMLEDIGLSTVAAHREANKFFWQA